MASGKPFIIAVDGRSGAGKTTLAVELAALLRVHRSVALFHLEDIYPGWEGLAAGQQRYRRMVLEPLAAGRPAAWTAWDWPRHTDGPVRTTQPADVVVVEGVGAAHAATRDLIDATVWIEAGADVRRSRALARDGSGYEPYWDMWAAQEEAWLAVDDVAGQADIVVHGPGGDGTPAQVLRALAGLPHLEPLLAPELAGLDRLRHSRITAQRLDAYPDAASLFGLLYGQSGRAVWLDSSDAAVPDAPDVPENPQAQVRGALSILADDTGGFGRYAEHRSGTTTVTAGTLTSRIRGPFFRWLESAWAAGPGLPAQVPGEFALGWIGYLGYELKREAGGRDVPSQVPDAAMIFAGRAVLLDHVGRCTWLLALQDADGASGDEVRDWLATARAAVETAGSPSAVTAKDGAAEDRAAAGSGSTAQDGAAAGLRFTVRDSRSEYLAKIRTAQDQIREGNSYEICLTTQLEARVPEPLDALQVYAALRRSNPAPFASFLRLGGLSVASTSPERFLRITAGGALRAEPIKGTRRRGPDAAADEALRADLLSSRKDRAENIMIVDLLRNDLSHFAVPGSLRVSRLCAVESYATVHQMVSTIDAQLTPDAVRAEAVLAAFPAGSMTGAPKISTMDILDDLETGPRGVYSGAIGYFSPNGAADLSVVIRTLVMDGDRLSLGVGGAITSDSVPEDEWDEVRAKAFGVLSALGAGFPD
ncbi:aminodeoxychorismate synthase component I [Arthrobacter sp. I2-34]|uniref:Aminodeoxychorismate synthase component I n=1 Tax=Arthrobacter hankyongi TaxID=2904801 RepID=A0ABS9L950_9MICC|nr:aminodeoxychorismate synthase component I [Arthrobacter hankyongi]MCG2623205.1 aminodeoxychorismate synthase component I [Arthrobacter hankyongi]